MLFSDSLLDVSSGRGRRRWSSVVACAIEAVLIAGAVVLPLWSTQALPRLASFYGMIGPPAGSPKPQPASAHRATTRAVPVAATTLLAAPRNIPTSIDMSPDKLAAEPEGLPDFGVLGATGDPRSRATTLIDSLLPKPGPAPEPAPPKPTISRVPVSGGVSQGYLLRQVQPVYPAIARAARLEGTVVLAAIISREGVVENLHAVSGPPMLMAAAIDAVRQWRYRPYLLNGQPVEVETQITVNFYLARN